MNEKQDFVVKKYTQDLDLTEILSNLLRALGKQDEKYLLHTASLKLSEHQIELTKVLSQVFPELAKRMPSFFQKRVEDYRRSIRISKLISFQSASSVEDDAVRRAWDDTRAMIREISMLQDESVKGLVEDHREILKNICNTLVELIKENPNTRIEINRDEIEKLLKGGSE